MPQHFMRVDIPNTGNSIVILKVCGWFYYEKYRKFTLFEMMG